MSLLDMVTNLVAKVVHHLPEIDNATVQKLIPKETPAQDTETSGLVGPQSEAAQQMMISAPKKEARRIFGHRLTVRCEVTDRHIPGRDRRALTEERKEVIEWLMNFLYDH
ncbi:hypothetical protein NW762_009173 [Fusarium torreyae]|uniref:Uncharacterized protein n=1 Tax=Fusarium torreyae TaxID=1237075 RepID=A0A9W8RXM4_9HYPO|nr:hypothetical protein NW762_009173 [Fusarium torreyae]